jgi:hypothetical protein
MISSRLGNPSFQVMLGWEEHVGGVWARENSTSQLQLNSILYRFHPSITWKATPVKPAPMTAM